jgi:hypothetical protein
MFLGEFEGFSLNDFELYAENKQTLPLFNSKRFLVAKKLEALGENISNIFPELFFDVSPSSPSVWNHNKVSDQILYFIRKESEQKKLEPFIMKAVSIIGYIEDPAIYHNHVMFGARVTQDGLFIYVHLNSKAIIDYNNLFNKLEYEGFNREFSEMLNEDLTVFDENFLEINRETVITEKIKNKESFYIGKFFSKSTEILSSEGFIENFKEYSMNLKPVFDFIQWNSLNDFIQLNDVVKEKIIKVKQAGLKEGDEVLIKDDFLFSGKIATIAKLSKNGIASIDINGIQTKIHASKLSKI